MKAKIEIRMDTDAFCDLPSTELARILRLCAIAAEEGDSEMVLRDLNGNTVGKFEVTK